MKTFRKMFRRGALVLAIAMAAVALGGCAQSQAAADLRTGYAADAYLQATEAAEATRSLGRELLQRDSPEAVRQRLEAELVTTLQAARMDDAGRAISDAALVQKRTIQATLWYEGERTKLQDWYAAELAKIDALADRIQSTGQAAVATSQMADRELQVSRDALQSFVRTGLPRIAGQALDDYLKTRDAGQVAEDAEPATTQ